MPAITLDVGRGTATGIDPSLTKQLQESVGVVYRPGDPAARKIGGRSVFSNSISGSPVIDVLSAGTSIYAGSSSFIYRSSTVSASFSSIWDFSTSSFTVDLTTLFDRTYIVSGIQSDDTAPFGAFVALSTPIRLGLYPNLTPPNAALIAGPGITGNFGYWTTEYDSTNQVESAYGSPSVVLTQVGMGPINQKVQITKPATTNASATHWRIYRTISGGTFPIGWLVATVAIGTATYDDDTSDASLVLNDPYRIVTINGIPESMDQDPQELAIYSITSFQGSLVGVTTVDGDLAFTPAGEPHSWPASYRLTFPTSFGGSARCVRKCGDALYLSFDQELFRINYLPDETDAVFDPNICIQHVANYGCTSHNGMCTFTAWGGLPVLFVPSAQGPMLVAGDSVDRAVKNIDWEAITQPGSTSSAAILFSFKSIDNPDKQRVEFYYRTSKTDSTLWACLHFYYDSDRSRRESGPLPEMTWTGPHPVPGPACYAIANNMPKVFSAGRAVNGTVYVENTGTTDVANLTDGSGTIPFKLRTAKIYPGGIDAECRADRIFIHKNGNGSQDYDVTLTANRENGHSTPYPNMTVSGAYDGVSSVGVNASMVSCDIRITADGTTAMAPINNITLRFEDQKKSLKTEIT